MIFAFTSDTHGYHDKLSLKGKVDVLLFGGDWTRGSSSRDRDTLSFIERLVDLPAKHKVVIAGNHDWFVRNNFFEAHALFGKHGIQLLTDSGVSLPGGIFVWGSPWTPKFCDWAFMKDRNSRKLAEKWEVIPENVDILMTHGPPNGILDRSYDNVNCGCELLRKELNRIKPKVHLFGHIHEGFGMQDLEGTTFINGSFCDRFERNFNKVVYFSFEDNVVKDVWT